MTHPDPLRPLIQAIRAEVLRAVLPELQALRREIDELRRAQEEPKPLRDLAKRDGRNVAYCNRQAAAGLIRGAFQPSGPGGTWWVKESDWKDYLTKSNRNV